MYDITYNVTNKNTGEVTKYSQVSCFSAYNFDYSGKFLKFGEHIIEIILNKDTTNSFFNANDFTEKQIDFHFKKLNNNNLKAQVTREEGKYFTIKLDESDYNSKSHIRLALDLYRLIFEVRSHYILTRYFSIPEETRNKYDYLLLLQVIQHLYGSSKVHHKIPARFQDKGIHSFEDLSELSKNEFKRVSSSREIWGLLSKKRGTMEKYVPQSNISDLSDESIQKMIKIYY